MIPKVSKKATGKPTKPITDFFTRKTSSTHVSSQPKPSIASGGQSHPLKFARAPRLEKPAISVSSDSSISLSSGSRSTVIVSDRGASTLPTKRSRTFMEAVEIVSPSKASKTKGGSQYLQPPSNSLKRPHSPDIQNIASLSPRSNGKSPTGKPRSRKSKFDSDSDHGNLDDVVYISKSARPGSGSAHAAPFSPKENLTSASLQVKSDSRKRPRLSSSEPFLQPMGEDFVPSSLSDEDMVSHPASRKTPQIMKQNVNEWLQRAMQPSTERCNSSFDDTYMDVDIDVPSPLSSVKQPSVSMGTLLPSPMHDCEDILPPGSQASSLSPLPLSPMVLDQETKSAQIIAEIKAKAYAASMNSPLDSPPAQFREVLDDSSDEEDPFVFSLNKGESKRLASIELPQFKPSTRRPSSRYSLRNRDQSPSPSSSKGRSSLSNTRPARITSSRGSVAVAHGKKPAKKSYDPLEELLKEKRLADKRGKGVEAFRLAEVALAGKDSLLEEMNEEDWTNEDAARMAVAERERMELKSSPIVNDAGNDEMVLDAEDKERLLGEERGRAIENILDGDRAKTRKDKENERVFGVSFWSEDLGGKIDDVLSLPALTDSHPILKLLKASVDRKDFTQATLLVDSAAIALISFIEHSSSIPYLCRLALSYQEESLNASSFRLLRHIWDNTSRPAPGISFTCILSCLVRIGAKPSVLENIGWTLAPGLPCEATAVHKRDDILYRLIALITSSARSRRLSNDEVPDILMAMLLVANEPSSSVEIQRDIMLALDEVCQSIASGADISALLESAICTRILNYTATLEPINKAYIVSVFEGGSGRTRRLARWIAHAIITDNAVTAESYNELPPLVPVLGQITGRNNDGDIKTKPGKLDLHQHTNYVDMGIYVQILAVALSNVSAYVVMERKARRPKRSPSNPKNSPDKTPPETLLEMIINEIRALHSSICDTRGAHLERSRTKAALHGLAFRVHYQRTASLRSSTAGTGKPRDLLQHWSK